MCGIAGFVNGPVNCNKDEKISLINKMLWKIWHRGPDEQGVCLHDQCVLGNVRLSIVDLKAGQQPMSSGDGRYWIVYNGEVFNHTELKKQLEAKGHQFRTNCDTEVVLHMYMEYGADCLNHFNGQFAIAIWDQYEKKLFLARDRVGIRPLFYARVNGSLVFGSEVKSLLEYPGLQRAIRPSGLKQTFTFWTSLTPGTIFEQVYELPPGSYAEFSDDNLVVTKYWELSFGSTPFQGSFNEAKEQLEALLKDSVRLRLRADVPVAAYLSGGLDSSITTAFVKEIDPHVLNTFSIGFESQAFDEQRYQSEVAQFFQTKHNSLVCRDADIPASLERMVWHAESPVLRTSPVPMMLLSGLVHDHGIKVVLTGEGADEQFGGYNIFKEAVIRQFMAKMPDSKLRPLLLKRLYPYIPQFANASPAALRLFFGHRLEEVNHPCYSHLLRWRNGQGLTSFFSDDYQMQTNNYSPVDEYIESIGSSLSGLGTLEKAQKIETSLFMSGYLLAAQGDRVGMANSVEGRYPFLDYRVIEFAANLPESFKLNGLNEKYILKKMMANRLPTSVLKRPKQAYRAPISEAIVNYGGHLIEEYLSTESLKKAGMFNDQKVNKLLSKVKGHLPVTEVENMAFIGLLASQMLYEKMIKNSGVVIQNKPHAVVRN